MRTLLAFIFAFFVIYAGYKYAANAIESGIQSDDIGVMLFITICGILITYFIKGGKDVSV